MASPGYQQIAPGQQGVLRVVSPDDLTRNLDRKARDDAAQFYTVTEVESSLVNFVQTQFDMMNDHRGDGAAGWNERMLSAVRTFNGRYDASKQAEIRRFGGSDVYARTVAMKCRGASSLLRDVYLGSDRAWGLEPPADPDVPDSVVEQIKTLVQGEWQAAQAQGATIDPTQVRDRTLDLYSAARDATRRHAETRCKMAEDRIEELLQDGGFYTSLAEFIVDLPLFPFACIKGPVVKIMPVVDWTSGSAQIQQKPKLTWKRVSPFDLWWTPGAGAIEDAAVIERDRLTRADLNDLLDLPGYNHEAIRAILDEYGRGGLSDAWDTTATERAAMENRENPVFNRSGMITYYEFNGNVQGRMLLEYGMSPEEVPDELRDYMVTAWCIGRYCIKVQLSPSPRKRHPYFITSFEKQPGTPVGNGLPDILADIQDVMNATLRSLVNNLAMSSGPQVTVNDDRLAPGENGEDMFPWKRWHVTQDPMAANTQPPISFFMPTSNAQELLAVYGRFNDLADELSAIPKYLSGQSASGAGRTAAGLAMLMGNASKILQTVSANIDRDIFDPLLHQLYDMLMLTDATGMLTGNESIKIMGVQVAMQRETQRSRQLEFLQVTANPLDMQIMGEKGRAAVLRSVSKTIGLDGEEIVPSEQEMIQKELAAQQAQQMQEQAAAVGAPGAPPGPGGGPVPPTGGPPGGGPPPGGGGQETVSDVLNDVASQAQGMQQGPAVQEGMGPRTPVAMQPGQGPKRIQAGP